MLTLLIPKETAPGETRVSATPDTLKPLTKLGFTVLVESGAGAAAQFDDEDYRAASAEIVSSDGWARADYVAKVAPPTLEEVDRLQEGAVVISFMTPERNLDVVARMRDRKVTSLGMELVPRVTRAQSMDALSSQATVAGYKASLLAATHLKKMCPLLMTAAGTVPPAKVVIFGAGVAGLQAIATCKRLGCVVEATDVRMAAKEQVESLGARFIDVPGAADMEDAGGYAKEATPEFLAKQREEVAKRVKEADIVITTAQIPGRQAPMLVSEDIVREMQTGAVIVDMAVESGGNCEVSERGQIVERHGVTIVGLSNLPATIPTHSSELYAKNVSNLLKLFFNKEGQLEPDWEDEILAGAQLTRGGEVHHEPTAQALGSQEVNS